LVEEKRDHAEIYVAGFADRRAVISRVRLRNNFRGLPQQEKDASSFPTGIGIYERPYVGKNRVRGGFFYRPTNFIMASG
jgi:hypothetical protein